MIFTLSLSAAPPVVDKSPSSSKSASDKGAAASLKCSARGAPDVRFTWVRMGAAVAGEGVEAAEGDKYAVTDTQVDRSVLGKGLRLLLLTSYHVMPDFVLSKHNWADVHTITQLCN